MVQLIKKIVIGIGELILINLAVLALIAIWAAYYSFGPMLMGTSSERAIEEFVMTEVVLGGGFLLLFNGYVAYRFLTGKNKQYWK